MASPGGRQSVDRTPPNASQRVPVRTGQNPSFIWKVTMPRLTDEARAALELRAPSPLRPSPHLTDAERKVWRALVAACPAGHLTERDRPMIEAWVSLTVAARKLSTVVAAADGAALLDRDGPAARALDKTAQIGKTLAALANRLKTAPLASHSAPHKAAQRKAPAQGDRPTLGLVGRK